METDTVVFVLVFKHSSNKAQFFRRITHPKGKGGNMICACFSLLCNCHLTEVQVQMHGVTYNLDIRSEEITTFWGCFPPNQVHENWLLIFSYYMYIYPSFFNGERVVWKLRLVIAAYKEIWNLQCIVRLDPNKCILFVLKVVCIWRIHFNSQFTSTCIKYSFQHPSMDWF